MAAPIDLFDGPSWDEPEPKGYRATPISRTKGAAEALLGLGLGLTIPAAFALALAGLMGWLNAEFSQLGQMFHG